MKPVNRLRNVFRRRRECEWDALHGVEDEGNTKTAPEPAWRDEGRTPLARYLSWLALAILLGGVLGLLAFAVIVTICG